MTSPSRPESHTTRLRGCFTRPESIQMITDGKVFYAYSSRPHTNELADDASIDIVITSPANLALGIGFVTRIGGDAEFKVYENVSNVQGGTVFVPRNRNRTSDKFSLAGVIVQPTSVTTNGILYEEIIIGGSGGNAAGATLEGDYAIIQADTSYLFRLTNRSGQARAAELFIQWVE